MSDVSIHELFDWNEICNWKKISNILKEFSRTEYIEIS